MLPVEIAKKARIVMDDISEYLFEKTITKEDSKKK